MQLLVSLLARQSPQSLAPGPGPPTPLLSSPRATSPEGRGPNPRSPGPQGVGGTPRSLTLVAVRQEVGAGPQILPVEAIYGDVWVLGHLSLEGTHSASQPRSISSARKPAAEVEECRAAPPLPGSCFRLTIGQLGSASPNHRSPAKGGGA